MAAVGSDTLRPGRERAGDRRLLRVWLYAVALMVVAMVLVGGATRLTDSGLSITEWKPIHGVVPPLNEAQWQEEFGKYQQIPEYSLQNFDMDLQAFKMIFWWEWGHRLLGRAIGLVFFVPLVVFWVTRRIEQALVPKLVAILVLGALQGVIGWWMVVSGLTVRTDVSQYRLAVHLTLAFVILGAILWVAVSLGSVSRGAAARGLRIGAGLVPAVAIVQIFWGGLVAGLDAGLTFNTWPLMDGRLVPDAAFRLSPWWLNLFENVAAVQLQHRLVAYLLCVAAVAHAFQARATAFALGSQLVAAAVLAQATLGVVTLLAVTPTSLALLHQAGAVVVVAAAIVHLRSMWPPRPVLEPAPRSRALSTNSEPF